MNKDNILLGLLFLLDLEINKKSNLYKLSNGVSFLGYVFKLDKNNKLIIRYNNSTIRKITKKLKYLKKNDNEQYNKSFAVIRDIYPKVIHNLTIIISIKNLIIYRFI